MAYESYYETDLSNESLINTYVHRACYIRIIRKLPSIKKEKQQPIDYSEISTDILNDISLDKLLVEIDNCVFSNEEVVSTIILQFLKRK